jgi:hypothetical protein
MVDKLRKIPIKRQTHVDRKHIFVKKPRNWQ